jgi:predicted alpha/beta superfamily hydrolase
MSGTATEITKLPLEGVWSPQLRNRRVVDVYLPPSYAEGRKRYPVLYMQDGQNLCDPTTAFAGTWGLLDVLAELARGGLELIVVGIHHRGRERITEYGPFPDRRYGLGKGPRYVKFLTTTLKPRIDRRFRTARERDTTAILGSSMGGVISLYAFFKYPRVFGAVGAMSPALWYGDRQIFDVIGDARPQSLPTSLRAGRSMSRRAGPSTSLRPGRIYLDMGTEEGAVALRDARLMADWLEHAGYRPGQSLMWVQEAGGRHSEHDWSRRLGRAIRFLFASSIEAERA